MIKLIASDIDGTLLPEGHTDLNPEYYEVIRELKKKGIIFVAASGRHGVSVKKTFAPVKDEIAVLSQNGCVLEYDGWQHVLKPIPEMWIREFWQDLKQYEGVEGILDTAAESFCPFDGTYMYHLVKDEYKFNISATGGWDHIPEGQTFSMATIYHPENAKDFIQESGLKAKWSDRIDMVSTGQVWVDCIMPGNSKGIALAYLAEKLGIRKDEIISFGDNDNDITMLQAAGCGYAVATAKPAVLKAADRIIPGFDQDGVLQVMKSLL